jgi:hypothetical protein
MDRKLNVEIFDEVDSHTIEKVEDLLAQTLAEFGLSGKIESSKTGNTTRFGN